MIHFECLNTKMGLKPVIWPQGCLNHLKNHQVCILQKNYNLLILIVIYIKPRELLKPKKMPFSG